MEVAFFDTSALLKKYFKEKGSGWLANFLVGKQIVVSELTLFEVVIAVRRRYSTNLLTLKEALDTIDKINNDSLTFDIIALSDANLKTEVKNTVFKLQNSLVVRTLDAIHLTTAVRIFNTVNSFTPPEPFVFVSSDAQLLRVAQSQKLPTENPEDHP